MLNDILGFINSKVPSANAELCQKDVGDSSIVVSTSSILEVCKALKEGELEYTTLQVISGVDYPDYYEVVYVLASFTKNTEFLLKVRVEKKDELESIPSVTSVWSAADWQERECFDMIGVKFDGHPDLRRILCPDDWEGFPLRKDYKVAEKYLGMEINPEAKMNWDDRNFLERQEAALKSIKADS